MRHAADLGFITAGLVAALLTAQCTPMPRANVDLGSLSTFARSLLGSSGAAAILPSFSLRPAGAGHSGAWLLHPQAETADCGAAVVSVTGCKGDGGGYDYADCGDLQSCVASILAGIRDQGIRPGRAELIRMDAFDTAPGGSSARESMGGMRLRFEQRVQDPNGSDTIYSAHVVLSPTVGGTRIATLITIDRGESYECFDAANLVFLPFGEVPCG